MPVAGEVVDVNDRLSSEPEIVNLDCYTEGWMLKIKLDNAKDLDSAMSADDYKKFVVE